MLLLRMKQEAEAALGEIGGAVVSVPVYATNAQRETIVTACKIADLELLDLISEPTATALAYRENLPLLRPYHYHLKKNIQAHNVMVFDIGADRALLDKAKISKDEVKEVIVVGGCSQIPKVRKVLSNFFGTTKLNMTVSADEAVARGAAIWAHELASQSTRLRLRDLVLDPSEEQLDFCPV
ncbi:hypothetical protein HAZT_HAZT005727 [Hyalella azteca]|uniref:Uncharacterized protein n=1 Tax=Hyalella azteca TaxID=294128 RepID=A0A6A0H3H8_HYAAZ|nr:hypothetical protein HAZT_HAZT005727 [Hyalella azteca]